MEKITININEIPQWLLNSPFYKSLDISENSENCDKQIHIQTKNFKTDYSIENMDDFIHVLNVCEFWGLKCPNSVNQFYIDNCEDCVGILNIDENAHLKNSFRHLFGLDEDAKSLIKQCEIKEYSKIESKTVKVFRHIEPSYHVQQMYSTLYEPFDCGYKNILELIVSGDDIEKFNEYIDFRIKYGLKYLKNDNEPYRLLVFGIINKSINCIKLLSNFIHYDGDWYTKLIGLVGNKNLIYYVYKSYRNTSKSKQLLGSLLAYAPLSCLKYMLEDSTIDKEQYMNLIETSIKRKNIPVIKHCWVNKIYNEELETKYHDLIKEILNDYKKRKFDGSDNSDKSDNSYDYEDFLSN
jgi:hypothetical protein